MSDYTNHLPLWNVDMVIIEIKQIIKHQPCFGIPDPKVSLIVEIDASDMGMEEY